VEVATESSIRAQFVEKALEDAVNLQERIMLLLKGSEGMDPEILTVVEDVVDDLEKLLYRLKGEK
jgi:hypothetical protein